MRDANVPDAITPVQKFAGMVSNVDPHDLQPGQAVLQVNVTAARPGQLEARPSLSNLNYDPED